MSSIKGSFLFGIALGALLSFVLANATEHETTPPPEPMPDFKISGSDYLPKGSNFRIGYVIGSLDAFMLSVHYSRTGEHIHDFSKCKGNWTQNELIVIVEQYMRENLEDWNHSAALLSHKALKAKCQNQAQPNS